VLIPREDVWHVGQGVSYGSLLCFLFILFLFLRCVVSVKLEVASSVNTSLTMLILRYSFELLAMFGLC